MSSTMQRLLEGWIGPSPQQQMAQRQIPHVRGGCLNVHGPLGDVVQAHAQARTQHMSPDTTPIGQTGARNLLDLTGQSVAQSMPHLLAAQESSDPRDDFVTSVTTPLPPAAVQDSVEAGSGLHVDDDTVMVNSPGHAYAPQVSNSQTQPQPQGSPNPLHADRQAAAPYEAPQSLAARDMPTQTRPSPSTQRLTRSQSQLAADAPAQQQAQGPVIGHGPMGPIYLHGNSPRRRRSQFSVDEDTTSVAPSQQDSQSRSGTRPRPSRNRGRRASAEGEARQPRQETDDLFLLG